MLLLLLRPLLILLLGSSLILLQLVWLLLMSTVQALDCPVAQLTTCKACAWGTLDGPDHPATYPSDTTGPAVVWALAAPVEFKLHEQLQHHQSATSAKLPADFGLYPCASAWTVAE